MAMSHCVIMALSQSDIIVLKDTDRKRFPHYEETHGLPDTVRLMTDAANGKTKLLSAKGGAFKLGVVKHAGRNWSDSDALRRDAYLLWRLSERYDRRPFAVGYLDRDRFHRLWQLRALRVHEASGGGTVDSATVITITWGRRSLDEHFLALRRVADVSMHATDRIEGH